jgi:hypothetical protein
MRDSRVRKPLPPRGTRPGRSVAFCGSPRQPSRGLGTDRTRWVEPLSPWQPVETAGGFSTSRGVISPWSSWRAGRVAEQSVDRQFSPTVSGRTIVSIFVLFVFRLVVSFVVSSCQVRRLPVESWPEGKLARGEVRAAGGSCIRLLGSNRSPHREVCWVGHVRVGSDGGSRRPQGATRRGRQIRYGVPGRHDNAARERYI